MSARAAMATRLTQPTTARGADRRQQESWRDRPRRSIMNVSRRVDYAVRALGYIAAQPQGRVVPRSEIQAQQRIPPYFLSKILRLLVEAGLLLSVSGARGGFRLGRPAPRISLREIYESVEGPLALIDCVEHRDAFCSFAAVCPQVEIWSGAQEVLRNYLENISLSDLADRSGLASRLRQ